MDAGMGAAIRQRVARALGLARGWALAIDMDLALGSGAASAEPLLYLEHTRERFASGDPVWWLTLRDGKRLLGSWKAAPVPPGPYRLGTPEPWGRDLWIDLQPQFTTHRSGLGIHHCLPGMGCTCPPGAAVVGNGGNRPRILTAALRPYMIP
jgi:hypothetical protein